jgi:hypothetical protein
VFAVIVSGLKTGLADLIVQKTTTDDPIDWNRVKLFTVFGTCFCGIWQYFLFNRVMPTVVPGAAAFVAKPFREKIRDRVGLTGVLKQIFIENGINNTFCYFPVYYALQNTISRGEPFSLRGGFRTYTRDFSFNADFRRDVTAAWSVWIPVQIVNFGLFPLWARVPFTALMSFGWTCWVSIVRGDAAIVKCDGGTELDKTSIEQKARTGPEL